MSGLTPPPRTVRPRRRNYPKRQVIAISNDFALIETGEMMHLDTLTTMLPNMDSTLFVKRNAADWVGGLDRHFTEWEPGRWQWRATENERNIVHPNGQRIASRLSTAIHYFGFKGGNYHKVIDPVVMYGRGLDDIWPGEGGVIMRLLDWGIALRDFCHKNHLDIRPTIGSISSQFLTDPRFYPKARRKVPAATNETVREHLPGNHYALFTAPRSEREYSAWYLDQRCAHHYQARTIELPNANQLYAYGYFHNLNDIAFDASAVENFYGLHALHLQVPTKRQTHWIDPNAKIDFVFSNEIPHLLDMGYRINGVIASWGSIRKDAGLARYAKWAEKQLDHYGDPTWLKPLLLSTYGVLATRPRYGEAVFKLARSGDSVSLVTGNNSLAGRLVRSPKKLEPRIANVLHRGMIEAGTRSESIGCAQWLQSLGYNILSIYADAIMVECDGPDHKLPDLPEPWRIKQTLNHLQFINKQAFISGEMTKLPGVSGELRERYHTPRARPLVHHNANLPVL